MIINRTSGLYWRNLEASDMEWHIDHVVSSLLLSSTLIGGLNVSKATVYIRFQCSCWNYHAFNLTMDERPRKVDGIYAKTPSVRAGHSRANCSSACQLPSLAHIACTSFPPRLHHSSLRRIDDNLIRGGRLISTSSVGSINGSCQSTPLFR